MNILMVSNEFPPSLGGVQTHVFELGSCLVKLGHSVWVLTRIRGEERSPEIETINGMSVRRLRLPDSHWIYDFLLAREIKRLVNQVGIDVIHVHGMRPLKACSKVNAPLVFTNHTSSFLKRARSGEKALRKMERQLSGVGHVIAPSEDRAAATRLTGYSGSLTKISNGVDVARFKPGSGEGLRRDLNIPSSAFVILFSGRLHSIKGIRFLAEALEALESPNIHLLVAGTGPEGHLLEETFGRMERRQQLHMLGTVANSQMCSVYQSANLLVLPSLEEATSIAGLEAMACGLPIIGSNVGGLPDLIVNGQSGLLIAPRSSKDLKAAIEKLANAPEKAKKMGAKGRELAVAKFSWAAISKLTLDVYSSVTK